MSEFRTEEFSTPGPISLRVSQQSGDLEVHAERTETARVRIAGKSSDSALLEEIRVELRGDELVIEVPHRPSSMLRRYPKLSISVVVPEDSALKASLASADLRCHGVLGRVDATTASGDVQFGDVTGDVTVQSASGDIAMGHASGTVSLRSASGDIAMGGAEGDIELHSASGDVAVRTAGSSVRARTASGDIAIAETRRGAVEVNSASGDVSVGVASGVGVWLDVSSMSGNTSTDLAVGDQAPASGWDLQLTARTMSGDVRITRTGPPPVPAPPAPPAAAAPPAPPAAPRFDRDATLTD